MIVPLASSTTNASYQLVVSSGIVQGKQEYESVNQEATCLGIRGFACMCWHNISG